MLPSHNGTQQQCITAALSTWQPAEEEKEEKEGRICSENVYRKLHYHRTNSSITLEHNR